jgi:hypothetical protein
MTEETENDKSIFFVSCANWSTIINADDKNEASALAIEQASSKYGKELCLAPTIGVMDVKSAYEEVDAVNNIHFMFTPTVLANAGMLDLAAKYSKVIGLMKGDDES